MLTVYTLYISSGVDAQYKIRAGCRNYLKANSGDIPGRLCASFNQNIGSCPRRVLANGIWGSSKGQRSPTTHGGVIISAKPDLRRKQGGVVLNGADTSGTTTGAIRAAAAREESNKGDRRMSGLLCT